MVSQLCRSLAVASLAVLAAGCTEDAPKVKATYPTLARREVPPYMRDSVYEYTDMTGTEPFPVSGFGLVANLHRTGGSQAPSAVRDYMVKELSRHQFGVAGGATPSPDRILESKNFAIVRVDGMIPPGARAGAGWSTWFDVRVTCLPENDATSLAHGDLYECDLKLGGANASDPGNGMVSVKAQAAGALFVNPRYVVNTDDDSPAAKASRRTGVVLAGARAHGRTAR